MSWLSKLIPHGKEITRAREESEHENTLADVEQVEAMKKLAVCTATAEDLKQINHTNGFSVALGNAFASRGAAS